MSYIPLAILVAVVAWFVAAYNNLVRLRNQVKNAWHQIDVQLKRRYDLIPNLVEVVKDYMSYEQETLTKVIEARGAAMAARGPAAQAKAENVLTESLKSLFAVVENYPELKANQNVASLQEELSGTENKISFARQFFNDSVMTYNNTIQAIPSNIIASLFNFVQESYSRRRRRTGRSRRPTCGNSCHGPPGIATWVAGMALRLRGYPRSLQAAAPRLRPANVPIRYLPDLRSFLVGITIFFRIDGRGLRRFRAPDLPLRGHPLRRTLHPCDPYVIRLGAAALIGSQSRKRSSGNETSRVVRKGCPPNGEGVARGPRPLRLIRPQL
jgi:LemA protein